MCGISGIVKTNSANVSKKEIISLNKLLNHRGPDGHGIFLDSNVALGHKRLSILDLSDNGAQPFIDHTGRYVLTYNGELYNFQKFKKKLIEKGHKFKSRTDSEVFLYSIIHFGIEVINQFNGMFAFGFYDKKKKMLILGRDRCGIKPLYYSFQGNNFFFASEAKAIALFNKFNKRLDNRAIIEYFTFQNIFTENTFFEDIKLFPSGNFSIINLKSEDFRLSKKLNFYEYWDFSFKEKEKFSSLQDATNRLDKIIFDSVKRQSISDVEVGSYLSGGTDSSLISLNLSKIKKNIKTFACGFENRKLIDQEKNFDESLQARTFAKKIRSNHFEFQVKDGDLEKCLDKLSYSLDEPRLGQSYPNFYISKFASEKIKVVLSGAGADELFAGYPWRYIVPDKNISENQYLEFYYSRWQRLASNSILKKLFYKKEYDVENTRTIEIMGEILNKKTFDKNYEGYINKSLYFETKTFLKSLLLVEDKISMNHGLETRLPFLDNEVIDFAIKCPINYKLLDKSSIINLDENVLGKKNFYLSSNNKNKYILRKIFSHYDIGEIAKRKKQGFSAPDGSWFNNKTKEYLIKIFFEKKNLPIYEIMDRKIIRQLISEHFDGKSNKRLLIWSFLTFNSWLKSYM